MVDNNSSKISPTIKLNNGLEFPRIGLGTYAVENIEDIVYQSIKDGVRHIDTAFVYENEQKIGKAIQRTIADGIVTRKDLFIVTKLPNKHKHRAEAMIKSQLQTLGLEYVDLYLDHWPYSCYTDEQGTSRKVPIHQTWREFESFVKKGYTKSIGVSNYNVQSLMDVLSYAEIKPVVNQFEFHPYLTQPELVKYCAKNEVVVTAYNSFCKGKYVDIFNHKEKNQEKNLDLLSDPLIKELAKKYKVGAGHVALNWALLKDVVVIPSTSNPNRMRDNLKALDFKLSEEDVEKIDNLNLPYRFNTSLQHEFGEKIDIFS